MRLAILFSVIFSAIVCAQDTLPTGTSVSLRPSYSFTRIAHSGGRVQFIVKRANDTIYQNVSIANPDVSVTLQDTIESQAYGSKRDTILLYGSTYKTWFGFIDGTTIDSSSVSFKTICAPISKDSIISYDSNFNKIRLKVLLSDSIDLKCLDTVVEIQVTTVSTTFDTILSIANYTNYNVKTIALYITLPKSMRMSDVYHARVLIGGTWTNMSTFTKATTNAIPRVSMLQNKSVEDSRVFDLRGRTLLTKSKAMGIQVANLRKIVDLR
jgi:hypothetical protein